MSKIYALRFNSPLETLEDADIYRSMRDARAAYKQVASELASYGNTPPEATIHIAPTKADLNEYPDYLLSFADGKVHAEFVY